MNNEHRPFHGRVRRGTRKYTMVPHTRDIAPHTPSAWFRFRRMPWRVVSHDIFLRSEVRQRRACVVMISHDISQPICDEMPLDSTAVSRSVQPRRETKCRDTWWPQAGELSPCTRPGPVIHRLVLSSVPRSKETNSIGWLHPINRVERRLSRRQSTKWTKTVVVTDCSRCTCTTRGESTKTDAVLATNTAAGASEIFVDSGSSIQDQERD